jgi:hypothetical protein
MFRCGAQGCLLHDSHAEFTRYKYRGVGIYLEYFLVQYFSVNFHFLSNNKRENIVSGHHTL